MKLTGEMISSARFNLAFGAIFVSKDRLQVKKQQKTALEAQSRAQDKNQHIVSRVYNYSPSRKPTKYVDDTLGFRTTYYVLGTGPADTLTVSRIMNGNLRGKHHFIKEQLGIR